MIVLLSVGGIVSLLVFMGVREFFTKHGIHRIAYRLATGHSLSGHHHTDATWTKKATRVYHPTGYVHPWHHMPRFKRMGLNWLIAGSVIGTGYGLLNDWRLTELAWIGAGSLLTLAGLVLTVRKLRRMYLNRTLVSPMSAALAPILDIPDVRTAKSIILDRDYLIRRHGKIGQIILPDEFAAIPGQRETIEHLVTSRLPVNVDLEWKTKARPQRIDLIAIPPMPKMIRFADALSDIRELPPDEVLLGYTARSEPRTWNQASEEPMMFVSAPSRRGKTTLAMLLMAQTLNRGGSVTAVDPKAIGLDEFCAGHPNANVYADNTDVQSMWDGIHQFRIELNERIEAFKQDRTLTFPRKTLLIDEVSVFNMLSVAHWMKLKSSKDKSLPPVWDDIMAVIFTGGQFNVNACVFGQRVDFRTLGGLIDGFGTRLIAGFDQKTYMRLIGIVPAPKSQKPRGRYLYFNNGDESPTWIQAPYGSIQEMRDYAMESAGRNIELPSVAQIVNVTQSRSR